MRFAWLATGILLNGIAGGAYIGAGLGPGPRDGLMTGFCRRTGLPVKWVRTGIEIGVLAAGWLLGGTVGLGTLLYAAPIGWIVHHALPFFAIAARERPPPACSGCPLTAPHGAPPARTPLSLLLSPGEAGRGE